MPVFYNYTENGVVYSFDDVFVPTYAFNATLWSWGFNGSGQLGTNDINQRCTPVQTLNGGTNWKQVTCGGYFTAAIKTDGTLWTWGSNGYGRLGDNTTVNRSTPVQTLNGGTNWKQVSGGSGHIAAIKTDGTLWTWGNNSNGKLGTNDTTQRRTPVQTFVEGTNWNQVACGAFLTAAIKTDGTLWTWGNNGYGGLGTNDTTERRTPVQEYYGGTNWKQVACGGNHMAAIKTDGTLWTWGNNNYYQLGDGTSILRSTPIQTLNGGSNWKQVACGRFHTAAVKTNGTLWTWGNNDEGQIGDNTSLNQRFTPTQTFNGGTNWKQVACGRYYTTAVKTDGTLWSWGNNGNGQLGDNTAGNTRVTPVQEYYGQTDWKQVSGGYYHTAAVTYIDSYI